ncbi:hypothetical protein PtrSN002B_003524 [Pyrenophora tritici-repentis]|nr:hypothetical protein PtrV1_00966 [Pyrenophora tritici-repentis]KAF7453685.1 hypothetical protein A1F99_009430 [Pyrenophora tritici-repentis]KAI0580039.1 hypothetical protein Alg215_05437 [Pyrenophora tritici-repentis]KAI0620095.1 hypothetical protein TUN199_07912 [Pyrenophora tritici-repentis]KAI1542495.1 hypothetical protein PtrSN001C_004150 [Pyrenophora tritici-repentis]
MGMEEVVLTMNVLEMLMCLVFRSLPVEKLREWLPLSEDEVDETGAVVSQKRRKSREGVVGGLNIASPLDQGLISFKDQPFVDLSGEEDELVQEWLRELERKRGERGGVSEKVLLEKKGVVDREKVEARKKAYAEKARGYNMHIEKDGVFVPHWVLLGAAAVVVGWGLFRSSGGPRRL